LGNGLSSYQSSSDRLVWKGGRLLETTPFLVSDLAAPRASNMLGF